MVFYFLCPTLCCYRIEVVQYLTLTRFGLNKLQRQTQSHEQTLPIYLNVNTVGNSKQSKPRGLDHLAPAIRAHGRWWPLSTGSSRHIIAARYYNMVEHTY